jgi:hypothetical protein
MAMRRIAAVLLLASSVATPARAEGVQPSVAVYYPGVTWYLRYELDGVLEEYNNHKAGQSTYTMARSAINGMLVSAQIAPANKARSALDCRDEEQRHIQQKKEALHNPEVRFSEAGGVDMELLVPLGAGKEAVGRHLHRFWLRDGLCAKVHASKTPFAEGDRAGFDKLMESVRFEPLAATFERAFLIPGRGTLLVALPASWGFRTSRPDGEMPRDVQFMEPSGEYQLMLTLFPDAQGVLGGDSTRAFVEQAREAARPKAVEADPEVLEMKGSAGDGLYFVVTDKNLVGKPPQPNNWKYLRQGALLVGESLLFFSVLSNAKESPVVDGALRSISEARLVQP